MKRKRIKRKEKKGEKRKEKKNKKICPTSKKEIEHIIF
jgi:hypothetical protein